MQRQVPSQKKHSPAGAQKPQSRKAKLNLRRFTVVMIALIFLLYFVYVMIWQQVLISKKNQEIDLLEEKITAAEQETERLETELENLNDPEYLERVAREKLGLIRPNERVFVDVNQSENNQND